MPFVFNETLRLEDRGSLRVRDAVWQLRNCGESICRGLGVVGQGSLVRRDVLAVEWEIALLLGLGGGAADHSLLATAQCQLAVRVERRALVRVGSRNLEIIRFPRLFFHQDQKSHLYC